MEFWIGSEPVERRELKRAMTVFESKEHTNDFPHRNALRCLRTAAAIAKHESNS
jgi:hypothetical protein